jgi:hypothetical protein
MTEDATEILTEAESTREQVRKHVRDAAEWFHDHEGEMFVRSEAKDRLEDELGIDTDIANSVIAELVGDTVDPIVQATTKGTKYVGVAKFNEFDGAYGYLDYHDIRGQQKRVVCAQCVHDAEYDTEVVYATEGDPKGSYGPNSSYDDLLGGIHDHYETAHDTVPEDVATGASLVSGTTIGGNTAWHAGNDGSGSGLDADSVDNAEPPFATFNELTSGSGTLASDSNMDIGYIDANKTPLMGLIGGNDPSPTNTVSGSLTQIERDEGTSVKWDGPGNSSSDLIFTGAQDSDLMRIVNIGNVEMSFDYYVWEIK